MTIFELHLKLQELGLTEDRYYLQGIYGSSNDDDKLSLTIMRNNKKIEYQMYFKERGEKHSVKTFSNESEACSYFYKKIKESKEIEDKYMVK